MTGNEYQKNNTPKLGFNTGKGALYFQNHLQGMCYNNNINNINNNINNNNNNNNKIILK